MSVKVSMNKALMVFMALSSISMGFASAVDAEEYKVGFVNVAKVLEQAPQAEDARGRIEREFAPRDRELLAEQQGLRSMEDDLVKDGAMMSEAERSKLERDIRNLQREIRRAQEEFREDLNVRRNEELGKIQRQVIEVIRVLAENEEYDLIVSDGVLFAGERVDITDDVLSLLGGEFAQSDKKDSENDN